MLIPAEKHNRRQIVRRSVAGALVGLEVGALVGALIAVNQFSAPSGLAPASYPFIDWGLVGSLGIGGAVIGAMLFTAVAALIHRGRRSTARLERELRRLASMVDEGLIDREDYNRLKRDVMAGYPTQSLHIMDVQPATGWGALIGSALGMLAFAVHLDSRWSLLLPFVMSMAGLGIGGAAVAAAHVIIQRVREGRRQLPPPPEREQIGSRLG